MQSFLLKQELGLMLRAFDQASDFRECLNTICESGPEMDQLVSAICEGGQPATSAASSLRSHAAQLRNRLSEVKPRRFFSSMEGLTSQLSASTDFDVDDLGKIENLRVAIEEFSDRYETFIASYSPQDAASLIIEARQVAHLLDGFVLAVRLAYANIDQDESLDIPDTQLSIYLPEPMRLSEFGAKVAALNALYEALAIVIEPNGHIAQVEIKKIESGSFWAKLLGDNRVIGLIVDLCRNGASFFYRNYTREGKIESIPGSIEKLNQILDFSQRLEDRGVDTAALNEEVRQAGVVVAKSLNTLLEGQKEVVVNNEPQSVAQEMAKSLTTTSWKPELGFDSPGDGALEISDQSSKPKPLSGPKEGSEG